MQVFITYIIKVVLVSGILYGYYWLMLRNKRFHQYNRFYLLSAMLLSIMLPFVRFSLAPESESMMPVIIQKDIVMDSITVAMGRTTIWTKENIFYGVYFLMMGILSVFFMRSLIKIYLIKKKGKCTKGDGYVLVQSDSKGTPFSFFKNIFWSPELNLHSREGEKMFRHELTHVRQYHSIDKLIANLIQILFWFNPFFGAIKRELNIVHEFLADSEAFEESDAESFSSVMLGIAYPGFTWPAINSFFHSPIKRRLVMLVKNNKQKVSYLGRIMILPLAAFTILFFAEKVKADNQIPASSSELLDVSPDGDLSQPGHSPESQDAAWEKVILPLISGQGNDTVPTFKLRGVSGSVLYIVDGEEIDEEKLNSLSPNNIESISVHKNKPELIARYGEKARNGVIEIFTKSHANIPASGPNIRLRGSEAFGEAMYIVDGKVVDNISNLDAKNIQSVTVLKNTLELVSKYGEGAKNGVVEIETKGYGISKVPVMRDDENAKIDTVPSNGYLFTKVESEAQFPGGAKAYQEYIAKKLAEVARDFTDSDNGKCTIRFIVNKDGTISDVRAISKKGTKLAEAFINAIRKGPRWLPAQQNGHYVNSVVLKSVNNLRGGEIKAEVKSEEEMEKEREVNQKLIKKYKDRNTVNVDSTAKNNNAPNSRDPIFTDVEKEAQFPGGPNAWQQYITKVFAENLDKFTEEDYGTCIVKFIVSKDGTVSNVEPQTMKGTHLASIVTDAIRKGPKWIPAQQNGHYVNAFRLQPVKLKNPNF